MYLTSLGTHVTPHGSVLLLGSASVKTHLLLCSAVTKPRGAEGTGNEILKAFCQQTITWGCIHPKGASPALLEAWGKQMSAVLDCT